MTDAGVTAADMLVELLDELGQRGVSLRFAELEGHVQAVRTQQGGPRDGPPAAGEPAHEFRKERLS